MANAGDVAGARTEIVARSALPLFTATLFLSAFLLFSVQPFFAKMVLPRLGGSPAVWSVAMVFFQGVLLLGYLYAHFLTSKLALRHAAMVHGVVLVLAFIALPIAIPAGWERPPESGQALWLLGLFAVSVGLPFFAVSANAPLLQAWFARTGHAHAGDPYFLYGASNIGSFASLFLFILLLEPMFTVGQQSAMWSTCFALLALLVAFCAAGALRDRSGAVVPAVAADTTDRESAAGAGPLRWIVCAFVPSGLLVAVTAHISVDVAAAPFLWVTPLALFLLTFVVVFRRDPLVSPERLSAILPWMSTLVVVSIFTYGIVPVWVTLPLHLIYYFVAALFCHSLLYAARPPAGRLTSFYLWMSFGGVLGGAFASLAAPVLFNWVAEYLLLIVAALLLRPQIWNANRSTLAAFGAAGLALAAGLMAAAWTGAVPGLSQKSVLVVLLIAFAGTAAIAAHRHQPTSVLAAIMLVPLGFLHVAAGTELFRERTFFGVVRVAESPQGTHNIMSHGTTVHGAMRIRAEDGAPVTERPVPLSYYHETGGIARALKAAQAAHGGAVGRAGAVGLGTGSVLCHAAPGEEWISYEIDRSVVDAARDPRLFRFIPDCAPGAPIVIGDARITLAEEPDGGFDFLLIDAFSSDAIPVHLMTREAVALYMRKLAANGMLVMHISNRYLELASVLAAVAEVEGLEIRAGVFGKPEGGDDYVLASHVAVMARTTEGLGSIAHDPDWSVPPRAATRAWTDDYSNVFAALLRRL